MQKSAVPPVSVGYSLLASNGEGTAVAAASIMVNPLPRGQITAAAADAEFRTAFDGSLLEGPVDSTSSILDVGRQTEDDRLRHVVIPFQLPNLGSGGFRRAQLTVFSFVGGAGQQSRTPINLFAIAGARMSASPLGSDVVYGGENALSNGYRIMSGYLDETTPFEDYTSSGPYTAAADGLGYWLNEAYANGANAGQYVFLRLSPGALEIASGLGFGVSTGDSTEQFAPTLSYTFNPAGVAGVPVISDFAVSPEFLEAGSSGTLSWSVLGADSVSIAPSLDSVAASGMAAISPAATTIYTLTATNASGTSTATATQTVVPPGAYRYFRFTTLAVRGDDTQASPNVPDGPNLADLGKCLPEALAATRRDYLRRAAMLRDITPETGLILDKNPNLTDFLPFLLRPFPEVKLLVARRDPRDILLSCFRLPVLPQSGNIGWLREDHAVEDYHSLMSVWEKLRECLGDDPGWLEVSYENLCTDFDNEARKITGFLGLDWHPAQADYRQIRAASPAASPSYAAVRAPVHTASIGRWQRYADLLPDLVCPRAS